MKTIYFLVILGVFLPLHGMTIPTLKQLIIEKYLTNSATTPHPEFITADLHDAIWDNHPAKDYFNQLSHDLEPIKVELASKEGPFPSYAGSPTSKGLLQFDLWNYTPMACGFDWKAIKERMAQVGIRNSLLVAPMPTASTSQILGNNETFEPFTANVYTRRVLAG